MRWELSFPNTNLEHQDIQLLVAERQDNPAADRGKLPLVVELHTLAARDSLDLQILVHLALPLAGLRAAPHSLVVLRSLLVMELLHLQILYRIHHLQQE